RESDRARHLGRTGLAARNEGGRPPAWRFFHVRALAFPPDGRAGGEARERLPALRPVCQPRRFRPPSWQVGCGSMTATKEGHSMPKTKATAPAGSAAQSPRIYTVFCGLVDTAESAGIPPAELRAARAAL